MPFNSSLQGAALAFLALLFVSFAASARAADEPDPSPQLRIEVGLHTNLIKGIAVDASGETVVTASHDKTARIWRRKDGALVGVLRPPAGLDDQGKLYAVAISPDGRTIAVGGYTLREGDPEGHSIYLFDRISRKLEKRISGLPNTVNALAFSPNGQHIVAGLSRKNGIRVYSVESGGLIAGDDQVGDPVYGVAWHGDRIYAASLDGKIRLWRIGAQGFRKETEVKAPDGDGPFRVAVSPDGQRLAVSYHDSFTVSVLDATSLRTLSRAHPGAISLNSDGHGNLMNIAWSADGSALWGAGLANRGVADSYLLVRWGEGGRGRPTETRIANRTVFGLAPVPGGGVVYASADPAWGEVDASGRRLSHRSGSIRDFQPNDLIVVSKDAHEIGVAGLGFSLDKRVITKDTGLMFPPIDDFPGSEVNAWFARSSPEALARSLQLGELEKPRGIAVARDGKSFALVSEFYLRRVSAQGKVLWRTDLAAPAWTVNPAGNGKTVVAALSDGTVRWYRAEDGKETLALFAHPDNKRWVMWTPEGYYDASPGGESLIGWHLNQGKDKEGRFIPNSQLYDVFYRPDIVQAKFRGEDISGLITLTAEQALKSPPPEIVLTKIPASSSSAKEQVCYKITSTGGGIGEVRVFQNGKLVKSDGFYREAVARKEDGLNLASVNSESVTRSLRALKLKQADLPNLPASNKGNVVEECQPIEPIAGENELGVVAFNAQNTVQSSLAEGRFVSTRPAEEPHLHILAIGIDQFADQSANLKFAGKDAKDFLELVRQKTGTLFKAANVHTATLGNAQATKQGILKKIDELSASIKAGDTFILFVASHGVLLGNQYYLVSAGYDGTADLKNLVGSNEIVELSKKIKALNQLYVFDTCHAGGVDNLIGGLYDARMSVLAKKMGLHIYAAAGGLQEALDGYQGNGLFTHALINSLKEPVQTDTDKDGKISVMELGRAAKDKTTAISTKIGHPQTPTMIHFGKDVAVAAR